MLGYAQLKGKMGDEYALTINGEPISLRRAFVFSFSPDVEADFTVHIQDPELSQQVATACFSDIPDKFREIRLKYPYLGWLGTDLTICIQQSNHPFFILSFRFQFDMDNWKNLWSVSEFIQEFSTVTTADDRITGKINYASSTMAKNLHIDFLIHNLDTQIKAEIEQWLPLLQETYASTVASLSSKVRENAVVTFFDFPELVKVPCQQYLLYFVQFLKDVGVDAMAELEEHAGRVLFAVTPTDGNVALEKVREALDIYLRLPMSPSSDLVPYGAGIEAQRLVAQIHHLNGQLMLASATLQQKDMLIQQQQTFINQQLLSGQVLISSIQPTGQTQEPDKESLVGDIVSVKKYETHGVEFDLPKLLRWLKERFADRDEE